MPGYRHYEGGAAVFGPSSRSLSVPSLHGGSGRRFHDQDRYQVTYLQEVTLSESSRGRRTKQYCESELEWPPRSTSPSTYSGHSTPSEVGDSGVCSDHDTPPPLTRRASLTQAHIISSDSDSEGNISEDSLPVSYHDLISSQIRVSQGRRLAPSYLKQNAKPRLPDALLKEIREKWYDFQKRRLSRGSESGAMGRSSGHWSRTRLPSSPCLSRTSSTFPSTVSLYEEDEDEEEERVSPEPLQRHRRRHRQGESRSLFEERDKAAGMGFAGLRDIFSPQQESTIKSCKGTVRGVKNRVRAGIATFTSDQRLTKYFMERERGQVVVYVTTLGIIRDTYERCLKIRKILWTLLVRFEEKDVFMSRDTQLGLLDRTQSTRVTVPHVFLEGQYLGDADLIERMNENGKLRRLLQPYRRTSSATQCESCGGFRLLPCPACNGSKKSVHRNNFTLEFVALKCSGCDESGLVKCPECVTSDDHLGTSNH